MASSVGQTSDHLVRALSAVDAAGEAAFYHYDFFRLVRLFEMARTELPKVGESLLPNQDILRFGQKPYQNFAPSTLQAFETPEGKPPHVYGSFFGLFGPCGALPLCFTEYAVQRQSIQRKDEKEDASSREWEFKLSDFIDLPGVVRRLRKREESFSILVLGLLPMSLRQRIQDFQPASFQTPPLRDEIIRALSATLSSFDLYNAAAESGQTLPEAIKVMASDKPSGVSLTRLNRLLFGLIYSREITPGRSVPRTPWDFSSWDFADLAGFIRQCREAGDPFSKFLLESFPAQLRQYMRDFAPGNFLVEPLMGNFIQSLNEVLCTVDFIVAGACNEMALTPEIRRAAADRPTGQMLARLNRLLIELAFPGKVITYQARRNRDETFTRFMDMFHHRMISFFYRAWAINQQTVDLDRPDNPKLGERQRFPQYIGSLLGVGMDSLRGRDAIPDYARLFYAGIMSGQSRGADGLKCIIQDYFGLPTQVLPFQGRWLDLPPENVCKLGESPDTGSMGVSVIAGSRMWDCKLSFRIRMGPMSLKDFERMLPRREILCTRCGVPMEPAEKQKALLERLPDGITELLKEVGGCPHCKYSGPEDWEFEEDKKPGKPQGPTPVKKRILCKKCHTPFGPEKFQKQLEGLRPDQITQKLRDKGGCEACHATAREDWKVQETGAFERLKCWVKNYLGDTFFWDLQLVLKKEEVPPLQLGQSGRLGYTTWANVAPLTRNPDDLIIQP